MIIKNLGLQPYQTTLAQMQQFTALRDESSKDEIWIVEHPPVYTLGLAGKREHLLTATEIPVVNADRGGQITYHGQGQLVIYTLLDINRLKLNSRQLVTLLENAMIAALAQYGIIAQARADAPGVYVQNKKIGSIGLRVKKGYCYHGLSLNNAMDLTPFEMINPCGYAGLQVTQLADFGIHISTQELAVPVISFLLTALIPPHD
jgi:lipoyl(octanoyl) transferase